jgi:hypothetical protein
VGKADGARSPDIEVDVQVAPPSRLATYTRGGEVHLEIDEELVEELYASHAGGIDAFRAVSAAGHAFLERSVRHLTDVVGVRQYLVMGSSTSGRANIHEIAQSTAPDTRAVYVLFDPLMLVYAHRLRRGTAGSSTYVQARLSDVESILERASDLLDLDQPVAVVMQANLSYVRSSDRAAELVRRFMDPLAPGSHLAMSHHAGDLLAEQVAPVYDRLAELAAERKAWEVAPRSRDEVAALLDGLTVLDPGVVPIEQWRPNRRTRDKVKVAMHAALAHK